MLKTGRTFAIVPALSSLAVSLICLLHPLPRPLVESHASVQLHVRPSPRRCTLRSCGVFGGQDLAFVDMGSTWPARLSVLRKTVNWYSIMYVCRLRMNVMSANSQSRRLDPRRPLTVTFAVPPRPASRPA